MKEIETWIAKTRKALETDTRLTQMPDNRHPLRHHARPTGLYNGMVYPNNCRLQQYRCESGRGSIRLASKCGTESHQQGRITRLTVSHTSMVIGFQSSGRNDFGIAFSNQ